MRHTLMYLMLGTALLLNGGFLARTGQASKGGVLSFAPYGKGSDIYLIDHTGRNFRELKTDQVNKSSITWAPDGRYFAYQSNDFGNPDIYVMDVRKKVSRQLTHHPDRDLRPAWAPNGKWIAFVSDRMGNLDIYRIDVDGSNLMRLTKDGNNGNPAWSPDSRWLAFDSYQGGDHDLGILGEHFLYKMDADGGRKRKLVQDLNISGCTWSPNGKQIAYAAGNTGREGVNIIITDVNGNKQRNLTHVGRNAWARSPAWSPDGKSVAYFLAVLPKIMPGQRIAATKFWEDNVICVIKVEGENEGEPLEETRAIASSPVWLPETFFPVSPSADKRSTLWGALKNQD